MDHDPPTQWLTTAPTGALLEVMPQPPARAVQARGTDADPDIFFPEDKGTSLDPARRVCSACPIREPAATTPSSKTSTRVSGAVPPRPSVLPRDDATNGPPKSYIGG